MPQYQRSRFTGTKLVTATPACRHMAHHWRASKNSFQLLLPTVEKLSSCAMAGARAWYGGGGTARPGTLARPWLLCHEYRHTTPRPPSEPSRAEPPGRIGRRAGMLREAATRESSRGHGAFSNRRLCSDPPDRSPAYYMSPGLGLQYCNSSKPADFRLDADTEALIQFQFRRATINHSRKAIFNADLVNLTN
jgi:hypothetical protein